MNLIVSILISCVGFVFFSYGRKMTRAPQIAGGLILMIFPYFISGFWPMIAVAVLIIFAIRFAIKMGW